MPLGPDAPEAERAKVYLASKKVSLTRGSHRHPLLLELLHLVRESVPSFSNYVSGWHTDVVEEDFRRVRTSHSQLVNQPIHLKRHTTGEGHQHIRVLSYTITLPQVPV